MTQILGITLSATPQDVPFVTLPQYLPVSGPQAYFSLVADLGGWREDSSLAPFVDYADGGGETRLVLEHDDMDTCLILSRVQLYIGDIDGASFLLIRLEGFQYATYTLLQGSPYVDGNEVYRRWALHTRVRLIDLEYTLPDRRVRSTLTELL